MFASIQKVISVALAVLAALASTTNVDVSKIAPLLGKIGTLLGSLNSLKSPSDVDSALGDIVATIQQLKSSGILTNSGALDEALAAIQKYQQVEADYTSGQVALLDSNFSYGGVAGDLIAVKKGGAAAQTLGL